MRTLTTCLTSLAAVVLAIPAIGQSVISTRSGVVYYFDGAVYLENQPLQSQVGKFPNVPQGAELRTAQGHAEVVLTPGVFLRMGENSSIRMLSNDLANTRVELETGSAIVDSSQSASEPSSGTAVTLVFREWQFHAAQAGVYRVDTDPPRLWVLKGEAEVAGAKGQPARVGEGMDMPLTTALRPQQSAAEPADSLSDWNNGRTDSIVADNSITQQIDADPATQTSSDLEGSFSYFPFLGVPVIGMGGVYSSPYGSALPAQPGFYSMYLPGYTYAPRIIVLPSIRTLGGVYRPPFSVATVPGRAPVGTIMPLRPTVPVAHPVPAPLHPVPHRAPIR